MHMHTAKTAITIFRLINAALSCFSLFRPLEPRTQRRHPYSWLSGTIRDRLGRWKSHLWQVKWTGVTADSATRHQPWHWHSTHTLNLSRGQKGRCATKAPTHVCTHTHTHHGTHTHLRDLFMRVFPWSRKAMITSHFADATLIWVSGATDQSGDFSATRGKKEIRLDWPWICVTFVFFPVFQRHATLHALPYPPQETKDASNKVLVGSSSNDRLKLWGWVWRVL